MTLHNASEWNVFAIMWEYICTAADKYTLKMIISITGAAYADMSGGEPKLLTALLLVLGFDIFFGMLRAIKDHEFSLHGLQHGVVKLLTYCLTIFLVCVISGAANTSFGMNMHIQDFFMFYMLTTEVLSILRNMKRIGLPVPGLVERIAMGAQHKSEEALDKVLPREEVQS